MIFNDLGATTLAGTRSFGVAENGLFADLRIDVLEPVPTLWGAPPSGAFPALYVLDSDFTFSMTVGASRVMQFAMELPPHFVVGLGYEGGGDLSRAWRQRWADLTPSAAPLPEALRSRLPVDLHLPAGGGADRLLGFIGKHALTMLEGRYSLDPSARYLAGSSLGSVFVLHTMTTAPTMFRGFALLSPALWWDDGLPLRRLEQMEPGHFPPGVKILMTLGSVETDSEPFKMRRNLDRLEAACRRLGFEVVKIVFEGETHNSSGGPAISRCLRHFFSASDNG